jgi:hypothetical protein
LEETKRVLRAQGHRRWGIHKKAMEILEADEPHVRAKLAELGILLPPLNCQQLEAYFRRSKKPRPKKSRAK